MPCCQADATVLFKFILTECMLGPGAQTGKSQSTACGQQPYLCKEYYEAAVVREVEVHGVELMESSNVILNQILLLIVQLIQICG